MTVLLFDGGVMTSVEAKSHGSEAMLCSCNGQHSRHGASSLLRPWQTAVERRMEETDTRLSAMSLTKSTIDALDALLPADETLCGSNGVLPVHILPGVMAVA